jgi:hypothetical protein
LSWLECAAGMAIGVIAEIMLRCLAGKGPGTAPIG